MASTEHDPGELVLVAGHYEELNVFGTPTGRRTTLVKGDRMPAAPRGFTWRLVEVIPGH